MEAHETKRPKTFHVMAKPAGAQCNLECRYCFYLEKEHLYPGARARMSDAVLESYVRECIQRQDAPEINFAWQGGEPTLMGLDFFRRAVSLQQKYCPPEKRVRNALQTNGILLSAEWCRFFHENGFLIGLSLDGPRELHDRYRLDRGGGPTFERVLGALKLLQDYRVEFNTLTVVHRHNAPRALEVYRFLRGLGVQFMQFIPLVERIGEGRALAPPPDGGSTQTAAPVTPWSVPAVAYGEFLCTIFDEWIRNDIGQVYVQLWEEFVAAWLGLRASLCVFAETCGEALIVEHNGDIYACDHYVYPEYNRGNVLRTPLDELVFSPPQKVFGAAKRDTLPECCRRCAFLFACHGDCPKHRFVCAPEGTGAVSYLCPGYQRFFAHADPYLKEIAALLRAKRSPTLMMAKLARRGGTSPLHRA